MDQNFIKKMAEKVGFNYSIRHAYTRKDYGIEITTLEAFAKSILDECLSICNDVENDHELTDYEGGFRDGALLCRENIKERFGLNEIEK